MDWPNCHSSNTQPYRYGFKQRFRNIVPRQVLVHLHMSRSAVADFVDSFFTRTLFQADDGLAASVLATDLASDANIYVGCLLYFASPVPVLRSSVRQDQRHFPNQFRIRQPHHHSIPPRLPCIYCRDQRPQYCDHERLRLYGGGWAMDSLYDQREGGWEGNQAERDDHRQG